MSFDRYPDRAAPLVLGPNTPSDPLPIRTPRFGQSADPDTLVMFVRVSRAGSGCAPTGAPHPELLVQADDGPFCLVPPFPASGDILDAAGNQIGSADLGIDGTRDGYLVQVRVPAAAVPVAGWRLQIRNTGQATARRFVWVVADVRAETEQPWLSLPAAVEVAALAGAGAVAATLQVGNVGTGPLRLGDLAGTDLGSGFVLRTVPATVAPNRCVDVGLTFTPPDGAAAVATVYIPACSDPDAGLAGRPETRVVLRAATSAPRWRPGDILVVDPEATVGVPGGGQRGALIRIEPSGRQTVVVSGRPLISPSGVALEPSGDAVLADPSAFGGRGGIIRVSRTTGELTPVASLGLFVDPSGLVVEPATGRILVVDSGAFDGSGGVIGVDPRSGDQTKISSGGLFVEPSGLVFGPSGRVVVLDPEAFGGAGGLIAVALDSGQQARLSEGGQLRVPSGIAVAGGGSVLVADSGAPGLIRVGTDGSQAVVAAAGLRRPIRVAVEADGAILVTEQPLTPGDGLPAVTRLRDGTARLVSTGALLRSPLGLAVVPRPAG
jgi:hypothetical protein